MNSPFVMEQARLTAQLLLTVTPSNQARLVVLYRRALCRVPTADEMETALRFLRGQRDTCELEAWTAVCQAMFACTEFRFME
jgi:hypothetical protein